MSLPSARFHRGKSASRDISQPSTAYSSPKGPFFPRNLVSEADKTNASLTLDLSHVTVSKQHRVGVIVSKTSSYYLVCSEKQWLPVRFADLIGEDGRPVERNRPFEEVKQRTVTVRVRGVGCRAYLSSEPEEDRVKTDDSELKLKAARSLCTDLTALILASKASNSRSSSVPTLLTTSREHLTSHLTELVALPCISETLERKWRTYIGNTSATKVQMRCPGCHLLQCQLLNCGHFQCLRCAVRPLCTHCNAAFSRSDLKLAGLWKS